MVVAKLCKRLKMWATTKTKSDDDRTQTNSDMADGLFPCPTWRQNMSDYLCRDSRPVFIELQELTDDGNWRYKDV